MLLGLRLLEATDWARLHHAYGRATDTPAHLRALVAHDTAGRKNAMGHLWSAIIHQGTPWTATGTVARVVVGLLMDDAVQDVEAPIRANLVSFLCSVAEAAELSAENKAELEKQASRNIDSFIDSEDDEALYGDDVAMEVFYARAILGCVEAMPEIMLVMLRGLDDNNSRTRACAAMGASRLYKHQSLRFLAPELPSWLVARAKSSSSPDERCAFVMAIGEVGGTPSEFLNDSSPAVRMCAALAETLAKNPQAQQELISALENHAADIDNWFLERPPQFIRHPRFYVIARVVKEIKPFERYVDGAIEIARIASKYTVDRDWGPLLVAAFPDGSGAIQTDAQARYLRALVEHEELWDRMGNAIKWFKQAGLAYDRLDCANRLKAALR